MDADAVIDSYVHDVARRLPPSRRNDIAYELRSLLVDDLRGRAEADGRPLDAGLAVELLRDVGRPPETAARYYRPFTIIEPYDTWGFLVAAITGGAAINLFVPGDPAAAAVLGWLGVLVVGFGVKNLILRYRPGAFAWRPRPVPDADAVSRTRLVAAALGLAGLLVLYVAPGRVVELVTGGRVAAERVAYSDSFLSPLRMWWLVGVLVAAIAAHLLVAVQGRWRTVTRWARLYLVFLIGVQLGWHVRYGDIFRDAGTDRALVPVVGLAAAILWLIGGLELYRLWSRVRPAPAPAPAPPADGGVTV